jgi:hypothetical protein
VAAKGDIPLGDARSALLRELKRKHHRLPPSTKKQCARLVQAYARASSRKPPSGDYALAAIVCGMLAFRPELADLIGALAGR